jgi:TonB-dependent Receptor Plug Domain
VVGEPIIPYGNERDTKFAVTCHRACYPRCLYAFPNRRYAAQLLLRRSYPRAFCSFVLGAFAARGRTRARRSAPSIHAASSTAGDFVVVSPTTVPTPNFESASSTTVITGADIESHQYRTVPDALSLVPGLNIVQTGGPGGQTSVFIRGTNSNHVKVLIAASTFPIPAIPINRSISVSC